MGEGRQVLGCIDRLTIHSISVSVVSVGVMPRESGASSNPCATGWLMLCPNRNPWLLDRRVKPGDDGNRIQGLEKWPSA
jgi:hypothetical protein